MAVPTVNDAEDVEYVIEGASKLSTTAIWTVAESDPALLVPVTVYVVDEIDALGVPEIWPVNELKDKPADNDGVIVHEVAGDPPFTGVITEIAEFLTKLNELILKEILGTDSTTANNKSVEDEPAEFVAVTR